MSASNGFRSGGFNSGQATSAVAPTFNPEKVDALEIGSKNRFLGNTLQVNAAVFFNKYKELQEQRQIPIGATTISTIFNAAKAEAKGLELEMEYAATDNLSIGGTLAYLDAEYTSFPDIALPFGTSILIADPTQLTATVVNGMTIAPAGQRRLFAPGFTCGLVPGTGGSGQPGAAYGCDLSGKQIPHSPEFSGSLYARFEFLLGNGGKITPFAVLKYSDAYFGQPTNVVLERQKAYTKVDVSLTWEPNSQWSVQLFGDNVTDEQVQNRAVWGGGGALQVSFAAPRTVGLRVNYRAN